MTFIQGPLKRAMLNWHVSFCDFRFVPRNLPVLVLVATMMNDVANGEKKVRVRRQEAGWPIFYLPDHVTQSCHIGVWIERSRQELLRTSRHGSKSSVPFGIVFDFPPTTRAKMMKSRVIAAIRGAFTADAASMGTHWIYNPVEMKEAVTSLESPEFKNPPTPRYYSSEEFPGHYGSGMLSPYGEQLKFVTEYLASSDEDVNGSSVSKAMFVWATTFGGRPDHATTFFWRI
jgi:hypothetical protein